MRPGVIRMLAALKGGFRAGFLPGVLVMVVYYTAHRALDMPWLEIASMLAVYAPIVGILLAVAIELVAMASEHLGPARGLVTVIGGGLGAAVCGIAPGAFGVVVFGAFRGPFIGTALIATSTIAGAFLVAMPAALRARRALHGPRPGDVTAVIVSTICATLILGAAATVIAPLMVDSAFLRVRGSLDLNGTTVGAVVGAACGGILGLYVGLVIVLARIRTSR